MPAKQILYSVDARSAIMRGVDQLAEAVKATLGPKGRNVVIDKKFGSPVSTKDGVTVAKEIELKDPFENMGAQMLREVASKTSDVAGDGTPTATVLAQAIFREGVKNVTAGGNPMDLKRGIDRAVETVVEEVKKLSRPTKDKKEIAQVGTISANNDPTIGDLIAEAMEKVGKDGVITVEEAKSMDTSLDIVEGMQFDRGYLSPYFVTDAERMEANVQDAYILLHEKQISTQIEETTSDYDREKLQERLAKLVGGVAVINVGAATEAEMKEKKARVEDALNATRAAVEEGVVPGGGVALIRCLNALEKLELGGDRQVGVNIIHRALEEPLRMIALNAGAEGATVLQRVKAESGTVGYDASSDKYVDMVSQG